MMFNSDKEFQECIQQAQQDVTPHKAQVVRILLPYFQKLKEELEQKSRDQGQNGALTDRASFFGSLCVPELSLHPGSGDRVLLTKIKYFEVKLLLWHICQIDEPYLFRETICQMVTEPSYCSFGLTPLTIYSGGEKSEVRTIEQILAIPRGRRSPTDGTKCLEQIKNYLTTNASFPSWEELFRKRLLGVTNEGQRGRIGDIYFQQSNEDQRRVLINSKSWRDFVEAVGLNALSASARPSR